MKYDHATLLKFIAESVLVRSLDNHADTTAEEVAQWAIECLNDVIARERASAATWDHLRARILARDLYICGYCLDAADEVDHIIPRCQGGADDETNLVAACKSCNSSKGGRTPYQWNLAGFKLPPWWIYNRLPPHAGV
jgi:hypothetical protein